MRRTLAVLVAAGPAPAGISLRAVALTAAAAIVVGAGVAAYATTRSSKPPELAAATRGAGGNGLRGPLRAAARVRYVETVALSNAARTDLSQFLAGAPPGTPQSEIDRRVTAYRKIVFKTDLALSRVRWPSVVAHSVAQLIAADRKLTTNLVNGDSLLNRSSLGQELEADASGVHTAASRVRRGLGLAAVGRLDDTRFSLL